MASKDEPFELHVWPGSDAPDSGRAESDPGDEGAMPKRADSPLAASLVGQIESIPAQASALFHRWKAEVADETLAAQAAAQTLMSFCNTVYGRLDTRSKEVEKQLASLITKGAMLLSDTAANIERRKLLLLEGERTLAETQKVLDAKTATQAEWEAKFQASLLSKKAVEAQLAERTEALGRAKEALAQLVSHSSALEVALRQKDLELQRALKEKTSLKADSLRKEQEDSRKVSLLTARVRELESLMTARNEELRPVKESPVPTDRVKELEVALKAKDRELGSVQKTVGQLKAKLERQDSALRDWFDQAVKQAPKSAEAAPDKPPAVEPNDGRPPARADKTVTFTTEPVSASAFLMAGVLSLPSSSETEHEGADYEEHIVRPARGLGRENTAGVAVLIAHPWFTQPRMLLKPGYFYSFSRKGQPDTAPLLGRFTCGTPSHSGADLIEQLCLELQNLPIVKGSMMLKWLMAESPQDVWSLEEEKDPKKQRRNETMCSRKPWIGLAVMQREGKIHVLLLMCAPKGKPGAMPSPYESALVETVQDPVLLSRMRQLAVRGSPPSLDTAPTQPPSSTQEELEDSLPVRWSVPCALPGAMMKPEGGVSVELVPPVTDDSVTIARTAVDDVVIGAVLIPSGSLVAPRVQLHKGRMLRPNGVPFASLQRDMAVCLGLTPYDTRNPIQDPSSFRLHVVSQREVEEALASGAKWFGHSQAASSKKEAPQIPVAVPKPPSDTAAPAEAERAPKRARPELEEVDEDTGVAGGMDITADALADQSPGWDAPTYPKTPVLREEERQKRLKLANP
jgi:hypothetical protein